MSKPIVQVVTEHEGQRRPRKKPENFRSSSIGNCLAQLLFDLADFPREERKTGRGGRIFDVGDILEWQGNKWLRRAGYTIFGRNFKVNGSDPERVGHIDGFILKDGYAWPYDWKTAGSYPFSKWLASAGKNVAKAKQAGWVSFDPRDFGTDFSPVEEHSLTYYFQAQSYMKDLIDNKEHLQANELFPYGLGEGFYFFVQCKDDQTLYEEFVPYNPQAINTRLLTLAEGYGIITTRAGKVRKPTAKLAAGIRARREYEVERGKLDWHCNFCPYLRLCHGEEHPELVEKELEKKR